MVPCVNTLVFLNLKRFYCRYLHFSPIRNNSYFLLGASSMGEVALILLFPVYVFV